MSDLDTLARWIDRWLGRGRPTIRIFASEFVLPTGPSRDFNFHVTERLQASWLRSAFALGRRWRRLYALGTFLLDEPPRPDGRQLRGGLMTNGGRRKPAYAAWRDG